MVAPNLSDAKSATPKAQAPASSADANGDQTGDSTAGADAGIAAPGLPQALSGADPSQPVAAAIPVNTAANAAVGATGATASGTAIGESGRTRAAVTLPLAGVQDALPTQTKDAAPQKEPPPANKTNAAFNIESRSSGDVANPQVQSGSSPSQQSTDDGTIMPALTGAGAATDGTHATARADALSVLPPLDAAGQPGAQTANGAMTTGALPNFGFAAANTATPSAAAATSGSAAAAAVPVAGLAVAIAARAQAGSNQFDIRLDPPELGRIDVRLDVDRNGQVTSHVTVDRADTLQLLQSQQPQLERALEQAGLKTADNGLQFTLRDQSFAGQNSGGNNSGSGSGGQQNAAQLVIPDPELAPVETAPIYSRWSLGSGIDIRV